MLRVTRKAVMSATGWSLENHVARVYDYIRFRRGKPPKLFTRPEEDRPAVVQSLIDWNADLGARHRMDWAGFLKHHQAILHRLSGLPRLGKLSDDEVGRVCFVVSDLERFKQTAGKRLVFGSKAAHFHFPWLVPVISSEVVEGLKALQRDHADELTQLLPSSTSS